MFKKGTKYLGFNDLWFTIVGTIIIAFLIPQLFFGVSITAPNSIFLTEWLKALMYTTVFWLSNRAVVIWFRKRYPAFAQSQKRVLYVTIAAFFTVTIINFLATPIIDGFFHICNIKIDSPTTKQGFGAAYIATFFILAIYESIWYYSLLKKSIQEAEQVKVAHIQSQLEGLRNQVNPHFLFNSLNTLNHIVEYEDKKVAKNFITQLSKVYRYILDSREESTIALEEELEFVKAYVAIQKERFLDNLQVNIEVPQQYFYKKIIPLSLQLLIENAIKHNIISTKKPLTITIGIDETTETIFVKNNLQKKSKVMHSTKVGLENIKSRYQLLASEKLVKIKETESFFSVALPILK